MSTINGLGCNQCRREFSLVDGIPVFLSKQQMSNWDLRHNSHLDRVALVPQSEHPFYTRFTTGWNRMLDLGSGDGVMSAGSSASVGEIFCVEPDIQALGVLKKRGRNNMYPISTVGELLPFPDHFFDGVLSVFVIEHLKNPYPFLAEVKRVLKPEGQFVVATDSKFYDKYLKSVSVSYAQRRIVFCPSNPKHVNLMTPSKFRHVLRSAGFQISREHLSYYVRPDRFDWLPLSFKEAFLTSLMAFVCIAV